MWIYYEESFTKNVLCILCLLLPVCVPVRVNGHVEQNRQKVPAWLRRFQVKIANLSSFFRLLIPKRDLDTKKTFWKKINALHVTWCFSVMLTPLSNADFSRLAQECKLTSTIFVGMRLWKTKHLRNCFQNFHQSYVLSTYRIKIH